MSRHTYTPKQRQFILDNYKEIPTRKLLEMFNKTFNTNLSYIQLKRYKSYYGLSNGLDNSGLTSEQKKWIKDNYKNISNRELTTKFNETFRTNYKEQKFYDYRCRLGLANGYTYNPREKKELEETTWQNGYVHIKVNGETVPKHRYLWEKQNGKIPQGYRLMFKDGNKSNTEPSNMLLLSNSLFSHIAPFVTKDAELNESIILLGKIKIKIEELMN